MARIYIEGRNRKADYKKIVGWVVKWRKRLNITDWTIHISLKTNTSSDPLIVFATMDINERYRDATLSIYPPMWDQNLKEQERTIVHELVHLPLNRIGSLLDRLVCAGVATVEEIFDSWETLDEWVSNVIWDSYEK